MRKHFNYLYQIQSCSDITLDDIGNICMQASNDRGDSWILLIRTSLGFCYLVEYGPFSLDEHQENYVYSRYEKFEYSEYKLEKKIDKFLNDSKKIITQVEIIDEDEARQNIKNVMEVLYESYK